MSIPSHLQRNFETLLRAARAGDLALMECTDAVTGEPRYVLCAVSPVGNEVAFTPFGHLAETDPFDAYRPPEPRPSDPCPKA